MDHKRSWFLHNGEHRDRTDGGIQLTNGSNPMTPSKRSRIGVRLDLDSDTLGFYLNGIPHGPIAFVNRNKSVSDHNLLYPAISLNYQTRVHLVSGLEVPSESDLDDLS